MHINQLTKQQLEQEIGKAAHQADLANYTGNKKAVKNWKAFERACMDRLNEIAPVAKISEDELLAELMA